MSAKETAIELVEKYFKITSKDDAYEDIYWFEAKACAIIAVDLILEDYKLFNEKHKSYKVPSFWQEVKQQISLL